MPLLLAGQSFLWCVFLHVDGLLFLGQGDVDRGRLQVLVPLDFQWCRSFIG